jgi:hypothetical protein
LKPKKEVIKTKTPKKSAVFNPRRLARVKLKPSPHAAVLNRQIDESIASAERARELGGRRVIVCELPH